MPILSFTPKAMSADDLISMFPPLRKVQQKAQHLVGQSSFYVDDIRYYWKLIYTTFFLRYGKKNACSWGLFI